MYLNSFLLLGALVASSAAQRESRDRPCIDLEIPVAIDANNTLFGNFPRIESNSDAVDAAVVLSTWSSVDGAVRPTGFRSIQQTFKIGATLCVPRDGKKRHILQLLTHGGGFNRKYWDSELHPEKYSYVDAALKAGYSVLAYDRIGTGKSDKPDACEVVGADAQVEIAKGLIDLARSGRLVASNNTLNAPKFEKVVAVGHSIGSALTIGLLVKHGASVDAAIPTGFIFSSKAPSNAFATMGVEFAPDNNPQKYGHLTSGYVAQGTKYNAQQFFLKLGNYEPDMLDYSYSITDAVAIQDALSPFTVTRNPATNFKGPVLFTLAELDFPICGGNCTGTYDLEMIKKTTLPMASDVRAYIQPDSGHGLAFHKNAAETYQAKFNFLEEFGL